jgi:uncharacterized protein (TIGR02118 family)
MRGHGDQGQRFVPNGSGARFDMDYYCLRHIPLVSQLCGSALKGAAVEKGLAGATPGSPPSFLAMGHLVFDSVESFEASFGRHASQIVADVPNYTNTQPIIQLSEIML